MWLKYKNWEFPLFSSNSIKISSLQFLMAQQRQVCDGWIWELYSKSLFHIPGPSLLYVVRVLNNDQMLEIAPWVNHSVQKWLREDESLNLAVPGVHCCTLNPPTSYILPALPKINPASSSLHLILSAPASHALYLLPAGVPSFRGHLSQKCLNCTISMLEVSEGKAN